MADLRRAVDLGRTLRSNAGIKVRQPLAQLWLALPGGRLHGDIDAADEAALLALLADDLNIRTVTLIGDGSDLVERRVKVLLPILGQRGKGAIIPAVMAAARADEVEYLPDGGVRLAGHELAADEVEIQATPRPGTAVAADDGIVVVIDTTLTDDLRAEGDARELTRALQDLRRQAELALDARIEVWLEADAVGHRSDWSRISWPSPRTCSPTRSIVTRAPAGCRCWRCRSTPGPPASGCARHPAPVRRDDHRPRQHIARAAPVAGVRGHRARGHLSRPGVEGVGRVELRARRGNAAPGSSAAPTPVLGDLVRIARSENDGGIFGMLGNSATILGIASLAVIAVIVWVQARQGVHSLLLTMALGLLLGGAVGNLLDRLRYGHVVDWVDTGIGTARFYTFNVADSAISIAVALLLVIGLLGPRLRGGASHRGPGRARTARSPTADTHEHRGPGPGPRHRLRRACRQVRRGRLGHLARPGAATHLGGPGHPRRGADEGAGRAGARCRRGAGRARCGARGGGRGVDPARGHLRGRGPAHRGQAGRAS